MRFKRNLKLEKGLEQINIAPLIDVVFLLLIFFMLTSSFTFQSGINVRLPKAVTSDTVQEEGFMITITAEDVIYLGDSVITVKELKKQLSHPENKSLPVMIKADRRASMGRIVDVWDLCRDLGIERINIATTQGSGS
ncbi:MAG: biopolymer transporter ExbD [Candidatus Omnitrophica bacterium]|nr:biopolymer transporter ExbD [Candidatus Omnitrophota bacterium]